MLFKSGFVILLAASAITLLSCDTRKDVTEDQVERVLKTLSSDEMKGRQSFSHEIDIAADFISNEFQEIGLSALPDSNSYEQDFTIYSLKPDRISVTVNNTELDSDHYFGMVKTESFHWQTNDVPVFNIEEENNYREKFREYVNDNQASIIRVAKAHKKWFHKYRSYFNRSNHTMELDGNANDVFVLYDGRINSFDVQFTNVLKKIKMANIAGMVEGKRKDEIVLFSAHYDHLGVISPVEQDSIANGANDNASGVTGIIELARYFASGPKPERTIYFVAFTAEEAGGYGSTYFSKHINPDNIVAMFNIEMIGKPAIENSNSAWITGYDYSTFGEILHQNVEDSVFSFYPDPYPSQNLFFRSDNTTLARLGVPAHTISTTPIDVDQDYHRVSDEFNTLNIPHIVNTINAIAHASESIISGEETPTRISPEEFDQE